MSLSFSDELQPGVSHDHVKHSAYVVWPAVVSAREFPQEIDHSFKFLSCNPNPITESCCADEYQAIKFIWWELKKNESNVIASSAQGKDAGYPDFDAE